MSCPRCFLGGDAHDNRTACNRAIEMAMQDGQARSLGAALLGAIEPESQGASVKRCPYCLLNVGNTYHEGPAACQEAIALAERAAASLSGALPETLTRYATAIQTIARQAGQLTELREELAAAHNEITDLKLEAERQQPFPRLHVTGGDIGPGNGVSLVTAQPWGEQYAE